MKAAAALNGSPLSRFVPFKILHPLPLRVLRSPPLPPPPSLVSGILEVSMDDLMKHFGGSTPVKPHARSAQGSECQSVMSTPSLNNKADHTPAVPTSTTSPAAAFSSYSASTPASAASSQLLSTPSPRLSPGGGTMVGDMNSLRELFERQPATQASVYDNVTTETKPSLDDDDDKPYIVRFQQADANPGDQDTTPRPVRTSPLAVHNFSGQATKDQAREADPDFTPQVERPIALNLPIGKQPQSALASNSSSMDNQDLPTVHKSPFSLTSSLNDSGPPSGPAYINTFTPPRSSSSSNGHSSFGNVVGSGVSSAHDNPVGSAPNYDATMDVSSQDGQDSEYATAEDRSLENTEAITARLYPDDALPPQSNMNAQGSDELAALLHRLHQEDNARDGYISV